MDRHAVLCMIDFEDDRRAPAISNRAKTGPEVITPSAPLGHRRKIEAIGDDAFDETGPNGRPRTLGDVVLNGREIGLGGIAENDPPILFYLPRLR